MIIKSVSVRNFRSILNESLDCDYLTALVGRNGSGKSTFLHALSLFYDASAKVTAEDFYGEDTSQDIELAVTFTGLDPNETERFSPYLDNNDLTVARVFSLGQGRRSGTYHGMRLQNPDFSSVRSAENKTDVRNAYNTLRRTPPYTSLPSASSADKALDALLQWEAEHQDVCVRVRDDGQFFGFTGVGQGYLGRYTRFIMVPAVRDASDEATERKGSCVTELMDLVVRSVLAKRPEVTEFKEDTQAKYREIMDPCQLSELTALEGELSGTLRYYAPDACVSLRWAKLDDIDVPLPKAEARLQEDGYEAAVLRTGHGLQRAFILTLLQHLIAAREEAKVTGEGFSSEEAVPEPNEPYLPNLVLAIEEPELYQHPSRQRHMAAVLIKLAAGAIPGVAKHTQVVYTTHAPLFVGMDCFDQVRVVRKAAQREGMPKTTRVTRSTLEAVAEDLWRGTGDSSRPRFTGATLRPRLRAIMTPWMNEGFFADTVVLVEGEDDRAAILGMARHMDHDLEAEGIAVIPCMGKCNLDRPYVIFRRLGIPTFLLWDSDKGESDADPGQNRYLLRLLGQTEEDWPSQAHQEFACFECELEKCLRDEIGPGLFDELLGDAQVSLGISKKEQALKNPSVLETVIDQAAARGGSSDTLETIVDNILALKQERSGRS